MTIEEMQIELINALTANLDNIRAELKELYVKVDALLDQEYKAEILIDTLDSSLNS